jgi:uncharacterized protein YbjT (DUF2867 family)
MNRILFIGDTGTVGRHVLSQLVAFGTTVRAIVRLLKFLEYGFRRDINPWIIASSSK